MPTPVACGTPHHGVTGDVKGGKVSQATDKLVDGVFRSWQSNYAVSVKCIYMLDNIPEKDTNTLRFFWYFEY